MELFKLPIDDVYSELKSSPDGLNATEVKRRLEQYGSNQIKEVKKKPIIYKFFVNLYQLLALLLWAASLLAFLTGTPQLGFAIIAVIMINAIFSFWQEYQAEKAIKALKKLLPVTAKVIRKGKQEEIPAAGLVPGDVIILKEGDHISADVRLVEAYQMQVDSSTLTGESKPVRKIAIPETKDDKTWIENVNFIFAGTSVSSGSGKGVIFATGEKTELSKIAALTQEVKETPSPLQKELSRVTQIIALLAILMGITLFTVNVYLIKLAFSAALLFAIGLTVANVPEGLLPTVTLALAAAVQKMARENALIKRLSSVETLGSTNIICTDKTGTITKNEMTVHKVWIPDKLIDVTGAGYKPEGVYLLDNAEISYKNITGLNCLLRIATFCNDAKILEPNQSDGEWKIAGDPTEAALLVAARKNGFNWEEKIKKQPRIAELTFDSKRKAMTTIHQKDNGQIAYTKGAPEKIIKISNKIYVNNEVLPFTEEDKQKVHGIYDELASSGLRILGMAYNELPADFEDYRHSIVEKDLVFVGVMGMKDPPRPEVKPAVEDCHDAGIRILMITGDYGPTARSIAHEVGISDHESTHIVTGKELDELSDEQLKQVLIDKCDGVCNVIFARAVPEHKMRIASLLQSMNEIVAMTGDGVNDAPALRKADIGVAMGISGTDVAKEASDMVLTDDNFATIVKAIKEGRTIYENIRKFITYIFSHETAEIIPFVLMVLLKIPLPITVMQILAIDLGTDTLPALALGVGPSESDVMDRPPRSRKERLLNRFVIIRGYLFLGSIEAALVMSGYFWVLYNAGWTFGVSLSSSNPLYLKATTMVFAGIVMAQIGNLLGCQTTRTSAFTVGIFKNKWIIRGIIFEVVLMLSIVYLPFMQNIFNTAPLGLNEWLYLTPFIPIMIFAEELRKYLTRRMSN